jgi:hypothetical protein
VRAVKKNESEDESEEKQWKSLTESIVNQHDDRIRRLEEQIMVLQAELEAMQKGDNTGFRHENDGGYFD